jgi:hypothetical protein
MLRRLYARVREMDPFRADAILAGAFAVASVIEALLINAHGHSRALTVVGSVLLSATIAWRRRNTMVAVIAFLAVLLVQEPLDTLAFDNMTAPFIEILLLGYSVGRHEPSRRMWVEVALIAVFINVVAAISDGLNLGDLLWTSAAPCSPAAGYAAVCCSSARCATRHGASKPSATCAPSAPWRTSAHESPRSSRPWWPTG